MTAAIDGSGTGVVGDSRRRRIPHRRLRADALPDRHGEHHVGQLAAVVSFSLAMSLFVAVTIVPVLCSRFLQPPDHGEGRKGVFGALYRWSDVLNED